MDLNNLFIDMPQQHFWNLFDELGDNYDLRGQALAYAAVHKIVTNKKARQLVYLYKSTPHFEDFISNYVATKNILLLQEVL